MLSAITEKQLVVFNSKYIYRVVWCIFLVQYQNYLPPNFCGKNAIQKSFHVSISEQIMKPIRNEKCFDLTFCKRNPKMKNQVSDLK